VELIIAGLALVVVYGWLAIRDQQVQINTLIELGRTQNARAELTNERISNLLEQISYLEEIVKATAAHTGLVPGEPPSND
jgi:hypothetical protein